MKNRRYVKWLPFGMIYIMINSGNFDYDFGLKEGNPSFYLSALCQGLWLLAVLSL